jgi:hypothetical protein
MRFFAAFVGKAVANSARNLTSHNMQRSHSLATYRTHKEKPSAAESGPVRGKTYFDILMLDAIVIVGKSYKGIIIIYLDIMPASPRYIAVSCPP